MNLWISGWKKKNWLNASNKPAKNKDLWVTLDELCKNFDINWNWVKGHSGDKNNDIVDEIARKQAIELN